MVSCDNNEEQGTTTDGRWVLVKTGSDEDGLDSPAFLKLACIDSDAESGQTQLDGDDGERKLPALLHEGGGAHLTCSMFAPIFLPLSSLMLCSLLFIFLSLIPSLQKLKSNTVQTGCVSNNSQDALPIFDFTIPQHNNLIFHGDVSGGGWVVVDTENKFGEGRESG